MKKILLISLLSFITFNTFAEEAVKEGVAGDMTTYQKWVVLPLTISEEDKRIRSAQMNEVDQSALIFDLHMNNCDIYTVNVNVHSPEHTIVSGIYPNFPAKMKIDSNIPHSVQYIMEVTTGVPTLVLNILDFKDHNIFQEMRFGTNVSFEFTLPDSSVVYSTFPLNGFEQATAKASEMCNSGEYFIPSPPIPTNDLFPNM